eukprot:7829449-Pyramimonas_sp.AAC.1
MDWQFVPHYRSSIPGFVLPVVETSRIRLPSNGLGLAPAEGAPPVRHGWEEPSGRRGKGRRLQVDERADRQR